jgi:hypothetical protein
MDHDLSRASDRVEHPPIWTQPEDVLADHSLSTDAKRAVLASWLSDAKAIPNAPALRMLESGATVAIDDIMDALRSLDTVDLPEPPRKLSGIPFPRRLPRWPSVTRRRRNDDDGPPPCPASVVRPAAHRSPALA